MEGAGAELEAFAELWRKAEQRLKLTERVRSEIATAAVNELRYAGYHLVEMLAVGGNTPEGTVHLQKGCNHCQRAIYDAVEAELLYHLGVLERFQHDYRMIEINSNLIDYAALVASARAANETLQSVHLNHDRDQAKQDVYEQLAAIADSLRHLTAGLPAARQELNKQVAKSRRKAMLLLAGLLFSAIAAVATVGSCTVPIAIEYMKSGTPKPAPAP